MIPSADSGGHKCGPYSWSVGTDAWGVNENVKTFHSRHQITTLVLKLVKTRFEVIVCNTERLLS
jgi:hypothetical protein